jgi:hypothetical protein
MEEGKGKGREGGSREKPKTQEPGPANLLGGGINPGK